MIDVNFGLILIVLHDEIKLFTPDSIPLTVADGKVLLKEIYELKKMLNPTSNNDRQ